MSDLKRTVRITTTQNVLKDIPPIEKGFPMRKWSISVSLLNDQGKEIPATIFDKVTYHLHPTFENPVRVFKQPPFKIEEQGWGEFDMKIALTIAEKGGERKLSHDLNFLKEKYIVDHVISVPSNKPGLLALLAESGPVPSSEGATTPAMSSGAEKRKTSLVGDAKAKKAKTGSGAVKGGVDLEKLAEGLTKLSEDDLLGVVQMVTDNRSPEMNIKNDVDEGEFTMDLYSLPDSLLKSLWEYVKKHADV